MDTEATETVMTITLKDDHTWVFTDVHTGLTREVDMGPAPTWPTAEERHDMAARAVRDLLDEAWSRESGEQIDRLRVEF